MEKPKFYSIDCLKSYYERTSQGYFFSPDTMRFFRSRLTSHFRQIDDSTYLFITTEKACFRDYSRVSTLRIVTVKPDSDKHCGYVLSIDTVEHAARTSLYKAKKAMNQWGEK